MAAETAGEERPGGNDFAAVGDGGGMTGGGAVGAAACDTEGSPEGDEGAPDSARRWQGACDEGRGSSGGARSV